MEIGFDAHAADYAAAWDSDPVAQLQRARVHEALARHLAPGSHVLDLGCGTGTDAGHLADVGHRVTAVDGSAGMLAVAAKRLAGRPVTLSRVDLARPDELPRGPFNAALADFGVLNCVALPPVGEAVASRLAAGGVLVAVVMSRHCPAESLALLLAGHPREAVRRRARRTAPVSGDDLAVRYLRPRDVITALAPRFTLVSVEALGAVLPPPGKTGLRWHPLARRLDRVDRRVARWPLIRGWGDHTLLVLRVR